MTYTWAPATLADIDLIRNLAKDNFISDVNHIFEPCDTIINKNITFAIVNQNYSPLSELLSVCKDDSGNLLAFTWVISNQTVAWSNDKMTCVKLASVDLTLTPKLRIRIIKDMMQIWEVYAKLANNVIVCSTTMRYDQKAFLKLHEKQGYDVRGSFAYKKLL